MNKYLHSIKQQSIGVGRKESQRVASALQLLSDCLKKTFIYSYLFLPFVKEAP